MFSIGRARDWTINPCFVQGHSEINDTNDAADAIIASPDRYLLPQDQVFAAEGGWLTCAITLGCGAVGILGVMAMNGRMSTQFGRGSLKAREWVQVVGGATLLGGLGQEFGIRTFGDWRAYQNHWLAYTFVKSQNRYNQKYQLMNAPMYF